jgi:hypothetical protein
VWATSWQNYVDHDWPGAWECVIFRREGGAILASDLIREAVACTRWKWGDPPVNGYITFIDPNKTKHKRDPGRCFLRAGFIAIWQRIKDRRLLLQMPREIALAIPPAAPLGSTMEMFGEVSS